MKRDGTLDYSAIVEGERRLENYYQEQGYFFADVRPVCSVAPPLLDTENDPITNETEFLCSFAQRRGPDGTRGAGQVSGRLLTQIYAQGDPDHRAPTSSPYEDIRAFLARRKANLLGIIPVLGYGRGYTSAAILEEDAATIRSLMAELGYRDAGVDVNQGVSPNGRRPHHHFRRRGGIADCRSVT